MAKIKMEVSLNRFVCEEVDLILGMHESRDYSGLRAAANRIRHQAQIMEDALHANKYRSAYNQLSHAVRTKSAQEAKKTAADLKKRIENEDDWN